MNKIAVLRKKLIRAYNNKENWGYSVFKGYPNGTYFGYSCKEEYVKSMCSKYISFYGKGLRHWRYI